MAISKSKREAVYRKYNGHCAYCGREIAYKDMQVDHFHPLRAWGIEDTGTDDLDNLMPACRMCNHYKRANSLETFSRIAPTRPAEDGPGPAWAAVWRPWAAAPCRSYK
jgi:5-methylcytosine-specific restriction endonuclease McrA